MFIYTFPSIYTSSCINTHARIHPCMHPAIRAGADAPPLSGGPSSHRLRAPNRGGTHGGHGVLWRLPRVEDPGGRTNLASRDGALPDLLFQKKLTTKSGRTGPTSGAGCVHSPVLRTVVRSASATAVSQAVEPNNNRKGISQEMGYCGGG